MADFTQCRYCARCGMEAGSRPLTTRPGANCVRAAAAPSPATYIPAHGYFWERKYKIAQPITKSGSLGNGFVCRVCFLENWYPLKSPLTSQDPKIVCGTQNKLSALCLLRQPKPKIQIWIRHLMLTGHFKSQVGDTPERFWAPKSSWVTHKSGFKTARSLDLAKYLIVN